MLSFIRRVNHYQCSFRINKNCPFSGFEIYRKMSQEVPADFPVFDATLSLDNPVKDYENLIDTKMYDDGEYTEYFDEVWDKMSKAVCDCIRKLLFDTKNPTKDQMDKASALLKQFKVHSGFHSPMFYNRWIYEFRDELLKREQIDFWKNEVVAKELGPCFARDSDLYDDYDDPEPLNFYKHAGCEAPWLNEESSPPLNLMCTTSDNSSEIPKTLKKLTKENALEDYTHNMLAQKDIDLDDKQAYKKIFIEVREILWELLFSEISLSDETSKMASELLWTYKLDACFFSPHDYNDWITNVRDELFKRKYMDFWQIIVNKRMGLCCYKDSNHFDDKLDTKPLEFYKSGDELMKQQID